MAPGSRSLRQSPDPYFAVRERPLRLDRGRNQLCAYRGDHLVERGARRGPAGKESDEVFRLLYLNSAFESGIKSPLDEAILAHGKRDVASWKKIDEVPFDFERRRVSVLIDDGSTRLLVVKGAPEDIIALSVDYSASSGERKVLDPAKRRELMRLFDWFGEGLSSARRGVQVHAAHP